METPENLPQIAKTLKTKGATNSFPEGERALDKKDREGTETPKEQRHEAQIIAYIERLQKLFSKDLNPKTKERNLKLFSRLSKNKLEDTHIIKQENIPTEYFEDMFLQAGEELEPQAKKTFIQEESQRIITSQKESLNSWLSYMSGADAEYPIWFKYIVLSNVLKLKYEARTKTFKKRDEETIATFPEINSEALGKMLDLFNQYIKDKASLPPKTRQFLNDANFQTLYAKTIQDIEDNALKPEGTLENLPGEWLEYSKENIDEFLTLLDNKNTGWCTAGKATAETYLDRAPDTKFLVYTVKDKRGNLWPRVKIFTVQDQVYEVRGVDLDQNIEESYLEEANKKLQTLDGGKEYEKRSKDMKRLSLISKKDKKGEEMNKEDLIFLYEIDSTIEGFGREKDKRIKLLIENRNRIEDMQTIFECTKEQIATKPEQVNEKTIAYIGKWNPKVYETLKQYPNIKHLYESFPDKKIFFQTLETDPNMDSSIKAKQILEEKGIYVNSYAKDLLEKTQFSQNQEKYKLVKFSVSDLGFPNGATTTEIFAKAKELDLELCPPEVGPQLRLQIDSKDYMIIAMEPIIDHGGYTRVFNLYCYGTKLELDARYAEPDRRWDGYVGFVFVSRK
jgi:hypothetical protein